MDKERATEVLIAETLKEYVKIHLENGELNKEDKDILISLLRVIQYVSLHDDYEKFYNENKAYIDISLGNKNIPSNSFTVTYIEDNPDGSANVEIEVGEELRDKLYEEGLNFLLLKAAIGGNTTQILEWAQRGKQEENTDEIMIRFNRALEETYDQK